jgi:hypothetical protein
MNTGDQEPPLGAYYCTGCRWVFAHNRDGWRHVVLDDGWRYQPRDAMSWKVMLEGEGDCAVRLRPLTDRTR